MLRLVLESLVNLIFFTSFSVSGCTDYFAKTEVEAFTMCRDIIESLNMKIPENSARYEEPAFNKLSGMKIYHSTSSPVRGSRVFFFPIS